MKCDFYEFLSTIFKTFINNKNYHTNKKIKQIIIKYENILLLLLIGHIVTDMSIPTTNRIQRFSDNMNSFYFIQLYMKTIIIYHYFQFYIDFNINSFVDYNNYVKITIFQIIKLIIIIIYIWNE